MPRVTPFTADVYRPSVAGRTGYREQQRTWGAPVLSAVACDIQLQSGDVSQRPFGRETSSTHLGFFPTGLDIRRGDGIQVTSAAKPGGERFLVDAAGDWGAPGDLELELTETAESFA